VFEPHERVDLGRSEIREQVCEPPLQHRVDRGEGLPATRAERQRLSPPIGGSRLALDEPGGGERRKELRHGRRRDPGAPGELRADDVAVGDRAKGEVLRDGQRRVVRRQQPLDPSARKRRDAGECVGGFAAGSGVARSGYS